MCTLARQILQRPWQKPYNAWMIYETHLKCHSTSKWEGKVRYYNLYAIYQIFWCAHYTIPWWNYNCQQSELARTKLGINWMWWQVLLVCLFFGGRKVEPTVRSYGNSPAILYFISLIYWCSPYGGQSMNNEAGYVIIGHSGDGWCCWMFCLDAFCDMLH